VANTEVLPIMISPNIIMGARGVPNYLAQNAQIAAQMGALAAAKQKNALAQQAADQEAKLREGVGAAGTLEEKRDYLLAQGLIDEAKTVQEVINKQSTNTKTLGEIGDAGQARYSAAEKYVYNVLENSGIDPQDHESVQAAVMQVAAQRPGLIPEDMIQVLQTDTPGFLRQLGGSVDAMTQKKYKLTERSTAATESQASTAKNRLAAEFGVGSPGLNTPEFSAEPQVNVPPAVEQARAEPQQVAEARAQLPTGVKEYVGAGMPRPNQDDPKYTTRGRSGAEQFNRDMDTYLKQNPRFVETEKLLAKDSFDREQALTTGYQAARTLSRQAGAAERLYEMYAKASAVGKGGKGSQAFKQLKSFGSTLGLDFEGLGEADVAEAITKKLALSLRTTDEGGGMPGSMSDSDRAFLEAMTPSLNMTQEGRKIMAQLFEINADRSRARVEAGKAYKARTGRIDADFEASPELDSMVTNVNWFEPLYDVAAPPQFRLNSEGKRDWSTASDADLMRGL
jgi:hypothetical protein